ncbi:hypothetical protein QE152_g35215 [Popillia japonica]|uniref:Uncharacterized protein n=1 Tax=Popillia japonica TaxID=7064 RepID=A0AAW1IG22_POPJA
MLQIMIAGHLMSVILFVVRGLITPIILGTDWLKKYAAEMDFVEEKIKFQYNAEILNLPLIRNNEEDGQASQEHNDIIATQTDQDILKFRWEKMQHEK